MLRMEREQIENSFSERRSRSWDPAVSVVILLPVRNLLQHAAKLENLAGEHDISSLVDVDEVLGPQVRRRAGQILVCAVVSLWPSVQNRPSISGRRKRVNNSSRLIPAQLVVAVLILLRPPASGKFASMILSPLRTSQLKKHSSTLLTMYTFDVLWNCSPEVEVAFMCVLTMPMTSIFCSICRP